MHECAINGNGGIGFIDPYVVNDAMLAAYPQQTSDNILMFLKKQFHCSEILFPYRHR